LKCIGGCTGAGGWRTIRSFVEGRNQKHGRDDGLILDIGMHVAKDTGFYLAKGFRVAAVEANPELARAAELALAGPIAEGRLKIFNVAICERDGPVTFYRNREKSDWGTISGEMAARNERLGTTSERVEVDGWRFERLLEETGIPYYVKIDIEGCDALCLKALGKFEARPRCVSVEAALEEEAEAREQLELLRSMGYDRFKIVNQIIHHRRRCPNPPLEGRYVDARFDVEMSGPFGEEAPGKWLGYDAVAARIPALVKEGRTWGDNSPRARSPLRRLHRIWRRLTLREPAGWYDFHARHRDG